MIATKVATSGVIEKIAQEWRLPMELAVDLVSCPRARVARRADS